MPLDYKTLVEHRIVAPFLGHYEADVFRTLRTLVLKRLGERNAKTLGICSAREGDGKSTIAINLAVSLSFDVNHTVLLVELDFRQPHFHASLGVGVKKGLADVLIGEATVPECLVNIGYERLSILPARTHLSKSSETIASPAMVKLASELRDRYPDRLILYDLPPVLLSDDFLAFMNNLDACLFIVSEDKSRESDIDRALSLMDREKIIGTVWNAAKGRIEKPKYYDAHR